MISFNYVARCGCSFSGKARQYSAGWRLMMSNLYVVGSLKCCLAVVLTD
jgi:hypothetical protein